MPERSYRPVVLIRGPKGKLVAGKTPAVRADKIIDVEPSAPQTRITAKGSFLPGKGKFLALPDPEVKGGEILISSSGRGHRVKNIPESEKEAMRAEAADLDRKMEAELRKKAAELKRKGKFIEWTKP